MKGQKTGMTQSTDHGLALLGGVFLLGALAGSLCGARFPWMQPFFSTVGQANNFWNAFWPDGTLLGILFLVGLLRMGCLPVLGAVAAKGFLLAAQSTGLVLAMGRTGYGAAAAQLLLPGFLSLAAVLLMSRQVLARWSLRRQIPGGKGRGLRPDGAYFLASAICFGLAVLAAAAACWLSPRLWQTVQTFLPMP